MWKGPEQSSEEAWDCENQSGKEGKRSSVKRSHFRHVCYEHVLRLCLDSPCQEEEGKDLGPLANDEVVMSH